MSEVSAALTALRIGIDAWKNREELSQENSDQRNAAIDNVMLAVRATRAYIYDKDELGKFDRDKETELSLLWQKAGSQIRSFDHDLYQSADVKSLGWGDPRRWENWQDSAKTIDLDLMEKQCEWLRQQET